jgi:glucokinase
MPTSQPIVALDRAKAPYFLGVDVGGTNIKIGLVDDLGQTLAFEEIETDEPAGPQQAVDRIGDCFSRMTGQLGIQPAAVARIGLGTPGTMDIPRGCFVEPPNLPHWFHFPIRDAVSRACGRPVTFINDANAASFGEFWVGTGAKVDSLILLTLGTASTVLVANVGM